MNETVTLYDGYYLTDTQAWLQQRIGAHQSELSSQLQDFTGCEVFDRYTPAMDIAARMQLWCVARQLPVGDGAVIEHDDQRLSKPVTIVLATTSGPRSQARALVSVDGSRPQVYADVTTDEGYWHDTATIAITCPGGHCWTWDGGAYLHDADGAEVRVTGLFGLGTRVISRCRDCAAFEDGTTEDVCLCSGVAIYCPICARRARIALPEVASFEEVLR